MKLTKSFWGGLAAGALALGATGATAQTQTVTTTRVASGLSLPLYVTHAPGDFTRIFIVEQRSGNVGRIRIMNLAGNMLLATPFLSVSPVSTGSEQGLLGLAFHPAYATNGTFFINYTNSAGDTIVARYTVSADPNIANPAGTQVLFVDQPFSNHNGGWIGFPPGDTEGYLYIALGDGGSANDPGNRAQNTGILLGKTLRLDIDGADNIPGNDDDDGVIGMTLPPYTSPPTNPFFGPAAGLDEIWAYGLRNHWRNSFDRLTGDFWIADVGQNQWEEINFQPAASTGGENYGWRCMEANACTGLSGCTCNAPTLTDPIQAYNHAQGCSITGGYVYRGCAIPAEQGNYFYADYCSNTIWSLKYNGMAVSDFRNRTAELAPGGGLSINSITSFGEDAFGEIYITDQGGEVYKILPRSFVGPDCNANLSRDACDILSGRSLDANANGIPDECEECDADFNGDGVVTVQDFLAFLGAYANGDLSADFTGDGVVSIADFLAYLTLFSKGCP